VAGFPCFTCIGSPAGDFILALEEFSAPTLGSWLAITCLTQSWHSERESSRGEISQRGTTFTCGWDGIHTGVRLEETTGCAAW